MSGAWSEEERNLHINVKELLVVVCCIEWNIDRLKEGCITMFIDYKATIRWLQIVLDEKYGS